MVIGESVAHARSMLQCWVLRGKRYKMSDGEENTIAMTASWWHVAVLIVWTLAVRGGVLLALHDNLSEDRDLYRHLAENIAKAGVYGRAIHQDGGLQSPAATGGDSIVPTAYRPPLYPLALAAVAHNGQVSSMAVGLLHLVLGIATVCLVYALGLQWGLRRWAAPAAALVACDPLLVYWSTFVMTETMATLLAVVALWCLTRFSRHKSPWSAGVAAGALALAALCRPTFAPMLVAALLAAIIIKASWRRRLTNVLAMLLAACIVLAPWAIRNQLAIGRPVVFTTHGGYTLLLGNNAPFFKHLRDGWLGTVWDAKELNEYGPFRDAYSREFGSASDEHIELRLDQAHYEIARADIRRQPDMFVCACLVRIAWLWSPRPHKLVVNESIGSHLTRNAVAVWYVLIYLLASVGLWSLRGRVVWTPWLWGVLLCLSFTAVHALYWSNMRMRAPLIPFVCLVAAVGAKELASWFTSARRSRRGQQS